MSSMATPCTAGKYIWGGNAGSHGIKFETDLAYALFVNGSLLEIPFRLATEMKAAGKWEDVVLFRDDLKEVWLFQAKHSDRIDDGIRFGDLFPNNYDGKKELALHMYLQAMMQCRLKAEFRGFRMRFFLFTNKWLGDRAEVEQLLSVESRTVDELIRWNIGDGCHQGFGPKDTEIGTLMDAMNFELVAIRDGIVDLLKNGKVSNTLVKYKTPLKGVLRLNRGRLQFLDEFTTSPSDLTHRWLFLELQKQFIWNENDEIKSTTGNPLNNSINPSIKALFEGNSRDKCFPILANEQDVRDFFANFILCLRQPDPKKVVDEAIYYWMRRRIPPNDLGKFSEAQNTLPRVNFYETFKGWHERIEKEKSFLSYHIEGRECIDEIVTELRQHMSIRSTAMERCYVPRLIQEVGGMHDAAVSDRYIIENIWKTKNTVLIGEPGMGKTTWMEHVAFELQKNTDMKVFLIYLNKLDGRAKTTNNHRLEVFRSELSEKNLNDLEANLIRGSERTMLLLDGFDELSESCHNAVINIIRECLPYDKICLIVSGRNHKQEYLEHLLQTEAIYLVPFRYEDQIQFLECFWNVPNDNHQQLKFKNFVNNLIKKLHTNIKAEYFRFTGLPLMIRMLAEIYAQEFERILNSCQDDPEQELLLSGKLNLLDLFEQFTCMSLNMQMKKILNQDAYSTLHTNVDRRFKINIEQFNLEHQLAAIKQLDINELLYYVEHQDYSQTTLKYMKRIQDGDEKSLLITVSTDNRIEFIHRSYAEYFAAKYLYENVTECKSVLLEVLQRHKVVQIFFFMMIEENIEDSLQQVKVLENICKQDSDIAFLACSGDNVKIMKKLLQNHSAESMKCHLKGTLLHAAAEAGSFNVVSLLLEKNNSDCTSSKNIVHRLFNFFFPSISHSNIDINSQDGDGRTPIFMACMNGHLEIVKLLVYYSANVDIPNDDKLNPLHIAYRYGHLKLVHFLIGLSKNLNFTDDRSKTLLHYAAAAGDLETVRMLLNRSVNIDIQDVFKCTALHYAVGKEGYEMVQLLLAHGPEINTPDGRGRTPLHCVALSGRVEIGKILIDHKASLDPQDNDGCTPLHLSYTFRNLDMINLLISQSANINIQNKDGYSLLHLACENGDLHIVKTLLDHSANVNTADKFGRTPLHLATFNGDVQIVKLLIQYSANVNIPMRFGRTALHMAAKHGHLNIVQVLLAHSAVHCQDSSLKTPLHMAVVNGNLEIVKTLITEWPDNINATDVNGWTPLHRASIKGDVQIVKLLIQHSAKVNVPTKFGETALHFAAKHGHLKIVQVLLAHSAVHCQDSSLKTPLHLAVANGNLEIVKTLITEWPDNINATDVDGWTPFHLATVKGDVQIVKLLIQHSAKVNVPTKFGETALHFAAKHGHLNIVQVLLAHSAVHCQDSSLKTPLHMAVVNGNLEIVKTLITEWPDNINATDVDGWTPFHLATVKGDVQIVKLLIQHSAKVNVPTKFGETALHFAAEHGHLEIVQVLLAHSAVHCQDLSSLRTPLHLALANGHLEIAKTLITEWPANVNATYEDGWTVLHYAVEGNRRDLVELLLLKGARVTSLGRDGVTPINLAFVMGNEVICNLLLENENNDVECSFTIVSLFFKKKLHKTPTW